MAATKTAKTAQRKRNATANRTRGPAKASGRANPRAAAAGSKARGRKQAARKTKAKQPTRARAPRGVSTKALGGALGKLEREDGCQVGLLIRERVGEAWEEKREWFEMSTDVRKSGGGGMSRTRKRLEKVALVFAAMGHGQRVCLVAKLLEGAATYQALQKVTGLKPGPLYHHINQLRLAGLIRPKQRDLYELTRAGRNLTLAAIAVAPMSGDRRRRP